jgi:hypothetical protein
MSGFADVTESVVARFIELGIRPINWATTDLKENDREAQNSSSGRMGWVSSPPWGVEDLYGRTKVRGF